MKKILVLGAAGMAGHIMAQYLSEKKGYQVLRGARNAMTPETIVLDLIDFSQVESVLKEKRPDVVINCVGILIQASQDNVEQAILTNGYLPHFLSRMGRTYDFKLIHISTDCVFSGASGGYSEDDFRDGDTFYARTKALGELINDRDLTLRTSIVGPELKQDGTGLLHWFLMQEGDISGYTHAYWSGITTLELAKVVHYCLEHEQTGLVNLSIKPKISKFNLLKEFKKVWNHDAVRILPVESYVSDKSLVSNRPNFMFQFPPSYGDMLKELRDFMTLHRDWYTHYPTTAFSSKPL